MILWGLFVQYSRLDSDGSKVAIVRNFTPENDINRRHHIAKFHRCSEYQLLTFSTVTKVFSTPRRKAIGVCVLFGLTGENLFGILVVLLFIFYLLLRYFFSLVFYMQELKYQT